MTFTPHIDIGSGITIERIDFEYNLSPYALIGVINWKSDGRGRVLLVNLHDLAGKGILPFYEGLEQEVKQAFQAALPRLTELLKWSLGIISHKTL